MLRDYYSRIDKYYSRFPSRSRGIRNNSVIPILWYDDIRKYIGRLRKWFLKEYGETIRYYVICEYGTQSFRPHYHLLLFHDSPRARADFRIVRTLPQSTKQNPREICVKLDLADLWVYGDSTSKVRSYLSGVSGMPFSLRHSAICSGVASLERACFNSPDDFFFSSSRYAL